jgi:MFS family permease
MLVLVAAGQFLGMTLWFSATAAAPAIAAEFSISGAGTAWLTMAVQAGFVAGTLASALSNIADVVNARRLFAIGCTAGALANAAIPLAPSASAVIGLRVTTGVALAFVYPPGLKIAAGWFLDRRGTALGIVVGALTIGSAFPHLLAWAAADVPWRVLIWISSGLALAGGAIVALAVRDGPHVSASAPFDPHAVGQVLRNRGARLATLGYLGHMWELYAMWAWFVVFFGDEVSAGRAAAYATFAVIAAGGLGSWAGGVLGDRWGRPETTATMMAVSGTCALGIGLAPERLVLAIGLVWGFAIVADSAQFSTLVTEHADQAYVGTALALQLALGFLLTVATIWLLPLAEDAVSWRWAFASLVPGPALGIVAMLRLRAAVAQ